MVCTHLEAIERAILARGIRETFRGAPWSENCREWVYFDCYIDLEALQRNFRWFNCLTTHEHRGTHDGSERGVTCVACKDAIMGRYEPAAGIPVFTGEG